MNEQPTTRSGVSNLMRIDVWRLAIALMGTVVYTSRAMDSEGWVAVARWMAAAAWSVWAAVEVKAVR